MYSEINLFVVLFSVILVVLGHKILNMTIDSELHLSFFDRCGRAS